jgi:L-aminopeptidase/D-esterase-like protein
MHHLIRFALTAALGASILSGNSSAMAEQDLTPVINAAGKTLEFDWPTIRVGTGEYEEGPTGVTVFHFQKRSLVAIDARGGGPGTVNSDYLRLGYEVPKLDAIVLSGGSWYGLESTTAVATALKDDGLRDARWGNVALAVGSIIYDFGDRRLNEVYPDKKLAQAAFRAARPGVFPLGAYGAGRMAKSGGYFNCNAHSGQGGAFKQIGDLKIAAFTVVNAMGVITRRDGSIAACFRDASWPKNLSAFDLADGSPDSRKPGWTGKALDEDQRANTTISLLVVNQKMSYAELNRLAVQVHTSMARGIQPFATEFDGDVLYAVSTGELEKKEGSAVTPVDIGVIAADVMWDAILASVPEQPAAPKASPRLRLAASELESYVGEYTFSEFARLRITTRDNKLFAQATGPRDVFAIKRTDAIELQPVTKNEFTVPSRYPLLVRFSKAGEVILNPGRWQQTGRRSQ